MTEPRAGRPPIGPRRPIRLSQETWDEIDKLASIFRITRTDAVRKVINAGLASISERSLVDEAVRLSCDSISEFAYAVNGLVAIGTLGSDGLDHRLDALGKLNDRYQALTEELSRRNETKGEQ